VGQKKLILSFELRNGYLNCLIEDNGIGRVQSNALKDKKGGHRHASFASQANQKRIDLINATQPSKIRLTIKDLPDNSGTIVALLFPLS
jgi:hypothetical protein